MSRWQLKPAQGFESRLRKIKKRYPREVKAVFVNLHKYLTALNQGIAPRQISAGFIHSERKGIIAIDQSGTNGTELRLYIHPEDFTVHLITIGDKRSQQADINRSHDFAKQQRRRQ